MFSPDAVSRKHDSARVIPSLTGIRGVLSIWVVIYHFWPDALLLFPAFAMFTPVIEKGRFAVPAFFILSGVVLAHNYRHLGGSWNSKTVREFLVKRLVRVYPVHFVSLVIVLMMVVVSWYCGWKVSDTGYSFRDFVLNCFLVHTWVPHFSLNWNYPSWSISSEWFAYLFFCPLMVLCHRISRRAAWVALGLSAVGSLAIYCTPGELLFRELLCVVPTFCWGVFFVFAWPKSGEPAMPSLRYPTASHVLLRITALSVLVSCFLPSPYAVASLLISLGVLINALYLPGNEACFPLAVSPVRFLGEVSYSLYMTHTLAQKILYQLFPSSNYVSASLATRSVVLVVYAALIVSMTMVMYFGVERPARRFSRNVRSQG